MNRGLGPMFDLTFPELDHAYKRDITDNEACLGRTFIRHEPRGRRARLDGYPMTQPVLFKQSFLIAVLAGVQAVMPAVVAVASLYVTIVFFGIVFDRSSEAIIIVAVLCLILVQAPREVTTQLTPRN
jgi:hypothetical protein